jgi:sugar lactone lactonase YvrE
MTRTFRGVAASALAVVFLLGGCAAPPKKKEELVFFPPPPEPPRIQYLVSFTGVKDIEEETSFQRFVFGTKENRRLDKPYGVGIHDGKIYVCDTNQTVAVFDLKEKTFRPLKGARGPGKLVQPQNISIEEDGTKYVTDPVRGQVVAFDRNDAYLRAYGKPGNWKPVDAAAFGDRLYVADNMNGAIHVFDRKSGETIKTIGNTGEDPAEKVSRPTNVAFDAEGYLYVTDSGRFQVLKFDRDGHFRMAIGKLGDNLGHFARPRGISLDREGRLYATDAAFNNVQIFNKEGRLLLFFGEGGTEPGNLLLPAKVVVDYRNLPYFSEYVQPGFETEYLIIVTSQLGNRMVNVFGYGREKGKPLPTDEELLKAIQERRQKELEKLQKTLPAGKEGVEEEKKSR